MDVNTTGVAIAALALLLTSGAASAYEVEYLIVTPFASSGGDVTLVSHDVQGVTANGTTEAELGSLYRSWAAAGTGGLLLQAVAGGWPVGRGAGVLTIDVAILAGILILLAVLVLWYRRRRRRKTAHAEAGG